MTKSFLCFSMVHAKQNCIIIIWKAVHPVLMNKKVCFWIYFGITQGDKTFPLILEQPYHSRIKKERKSARPTSTPFILLASLFLTKKRAFPPGDVLKTEQINLLFFLLLQKMHFWMEMLRWQGYYKTNCKWTSKQGLIPRRLLLHVCGHHQELF